MKPIEYFNAYKVFFKGICTNVTCDFYANCQVTSDGLPGKKELKHFLNETEYL